MTDQSTAASDQQLVIRGLRVAPLGHPDREILQGIDLTVGKGEVHAIMGPNGSGKTTLAYALMGHPAYVVNAGEVLWKGRDILKLDEDEIRKVRGNDIAMVFQEPMTSLNPVLTIGRQMTEALELHMDLHGKGARDRAALRPQGRLCS